MLICFILFPKEAEAQTDSIPENRFTTHAMTFGIGTVNILDTYLSPQEYTGTQFHFMRETMRKTKWIKGKISTQSMLQGNFSTTRTQSREGKELAGGVAWSIGWHYNWLPSPSLRLMAGGVIDMNGGFVYNTRNGNNPAQAKASTDIAASMIAIYKFNIKRHDFTARYQLNVPLAGLMFSPDYGQSYYEIFTVGNYDHNLCATSFFNAPSLTSLLSLDFAVSSTILRIGYLCDVRQSRVNSLKYHSWSHTFVMGYVKHFCLIKQRDLNRKKLIY